MNDIIKNAYRIWHVSQKDYREAILRGTSDGLEFDVIGTFNITPSDKDRCILDEIYCDHQNGIEEITKRPCRNPARTRSLSVGDVIQIFDERGVSSYRRVGNVGFERVRRVNDSFERIEQ